MKKQYRGLIISDLHCGSAIGLLPPEVPLPQPMPGFVFNNKNGDPELEASMFCSSLRQNRGQEYLWRCWQDMISQLPPTLDFIVVNGDMIQGPAKMNGEAYETITTRPSFQCLIAREALRPLRERTNMFYMIRGTEWHVGSYGENCQVLAESLQATQFPEGERLGEMLFLDIDGVILDIAHDISYFMVYRNTALEREINFSRVDQCLLEGAPDLIIRSHTHTYGTVQNRWATAVTTPGWQFSLRFARKKSAARGRMTDIGAILVTIEPWQKKRGEIPVQIKPYLYQHPKYQTVRL